MKFLTIIVLLCVSSKSLLGDIEAKPTTTDSSEEYVEKTEAQIVFDKLSNEEKPYFILLHLALAINARATAYVNQTFLELPEATAIPADTFSYLQTLETPSDFSENLLDWTQSEFELTNDDVRQLVTYSQVCFPSGNCVDPGDVGSACCPF